MENTWETIKKNCVDQFEKRLEFFIGKLKKIRSDRISLETIRGLKINYQGEKKPIKIIANLRISPNHELVIQAFEPNLTSLISKAVLDEQLGYKQEKISKDEVIFTLLPMTGEMRKKLIKDVKEIIEEGKKFFRLIHQDIKSALKKDKNLSQDQKKNYEKQGDKLFKDYQDRFAVAWEKKIKELSS
ncbi:ribosome-recycling factor [endosymbiont GvMRE of Glomus versiforme]|uniref:ribosome-recycling factor n=1 Tax=endosymbiont GvMRE of Glomus versiforme TaxID=2039283 RepID=UPI000EBC9E77|nr:ribosome recycling factor [endosymbiont GvMRE of Glomus versiforme]RHZ35587.1 Ribosome recycling factor [endosymbiont GvMRE of Glomus versiforme]